LERNRFSVAKDKVNATAFLPPKNLLLSVFHTTDVTEQEVWAIGQKEVATPMGKPLYARADIKVSDVPKTLSVRLDREPPKHVTIYGWPIDKKEAQLALALEMAVAATLVINRGAETAP
jgi:hypothetical protein